MSCSVELAWKQVTWGQMLLAVDKYNLNNVFFVKYNNIKSKSRLGLVDKPFPIALGPELQYLIKVKEDLG